MNTALWLAASALAVAFVVTGLMKLRQSKASLGTTMGWVEDFSPTQIKAVVAWGRLGPYPL